MRASVGASRQTRRALSLLLLSAFLQPVVAAEPSAVGRGAGVYNYYCYQCHGYSGDARTLASTYLSPAPRNFTATSPDDLPRDRMIASVTHGRPGTAMTAFDSVLSAADVAAVVDYVRETFMGPAKPQLRYHTAANGWPDHERYAAAFPFVTGELSLGEDWESLTDAQQSGKRLYLTACVTCHDHATTRDEGPVWELRALSYPRKHYSHRMNVDALSGASPYAVHDQPPSHENLTQLETRGEQLYQENCAFCHAADGSARNWIGSFLEPRPRDLTRFAALAADSQLLGTVIREGLPQTSMPAWKHVLSNADIDAIIAYMQRVFVN